MAILAALTFGLMFSVTGGAIDFGRVYKARNQTQNVMDAAVLAGGRVLQTSQSEAEAIAAAKSYYAQMKSPLVTHGEPSFTIEQNKTMVRGTIDGGVDTVMLGLMSFTQLPVKVRAQSQLAGGAGAGTSYEISLMLDLTGSMCDDGNGPCSAGTKISALKAAAKDLINIALWDNQSTYTSKAALVPFSTRIRVGPDNGGGPLMKKLTDLDPTWTGWYSTCTSSSGGGGSESGGDWTCSSYATQRKVNWPILPCVTDRTGPQEFTDAEPGSNTWLNAHGGDRMPKSWDSSDTAPSNQMGKTSADPATFWNYDDGGYCADVDPANEIVPLSSDKSMLSAKIDALQAYGATSGALATAWAWYMISPRWSGVWTGDSAPAPYGDLTTIVDGRPKLKKVAILMTDGDYNTYRGWKDSDQLMVSANARSICQNMKAAGVEIYTVGFGLDLLPAVKRTEAENTLKSCGSDIQHFYNALDVAQLQGAFRDIALKLAMLRINK